jgi:hypothetical protein
MKAIEVGAAPHRAEPTSKRMTEARKTRRLLAKVYRRPKVSWTAQLART